VQIIDANPGNATFDQVVKTINTGGGGVGVAISPDGTRAYVLGEDGVVSVIDLAADAVVRTVSTGGGGQGVAITPDGTLLFVLLTNGEVAIIDLVPGSPTENQVVRTVNTGGGGQGIGVSPDGGLLYITNGDGNTVSVFEIVTGGGSGSGSIVPGPGVNLQFVTTVAVGDNPAGIAFDPRGTYVVVVNEGSGTVTIIGQPTSLPPVTIEFEFNPNTLNLQSMGRWVTGYIEPQPPFGAGEIDIASIRLNGVLAVDQDGPTSIGDHDADGTPDLSVRFLRSAVKLILPAGNRVPVTATGQVGPRLFTGTDYIRVIHAPVLAPLAGAVVPPGQPYTVRWSTPGGVNVQSVAVLHSFDRGATWQLDATQVPNTDEFVWNVPAVIADSVKVAIVLVESSGGEDEVTGVLGVSDYFTIFGATDVVPAPSELTFAPIQPNPASGGASMRFGLPRASRVKLELFDVQGRRVATLLDGGRPAGWHDVRWGGTSQSGTPVGPGLYFVRFRADARTLEQRLVWLR
jgi:hypothetical protein